MSTAQSALAASWHGCRLCATACQRGPEGAARNYALLPIILRNNEDLHLVVEGWKGWERERSRQLTQSIIAEHRSQLVSTDVAVIIHDHVKEVSDDKISRQDLQSQSFLFELFFCLLVWTLCFLFFWLFLLVLSWCFRVALCLFCFCVVSDCFWLFFGFCIVCCFLIALCLFFHCFWFRWWLHCVLLSWWSPCVLFEFALHQISKL